MRKDKSTKSTPKSTKSTRAAGKGRDHHPYVPAAPAILSDVSRRSVLAGAAVGGLTAAGLGFSNVMGTSAAKAQGGPPPPQGPKERTLLKNGTILRMEDPKKDLEKGDVLIEGKKIKQIGKNLQIGSGAAVVDCSGKIVMPGFCDPHIHSWQGQLPRLIANQNSGVDATHNYFTVYHDTFAPAYRPEDMYIGTLMTMLVAINGGITTVCDNSHNSRSSDHNDAAVEALFDSGIRGVHASGPPTSGDWDMNWPEDVYRLAEKFFTSEDQLVTLRLLPRRAFPGDHPLVLQVRQDLDLWLTNDGGSRLPLVDLYAAGTYNGKESFNHGVGFSEAQRKAIVDNGAKVNMCPRIETQFWTGAGFGRDGTIPIQEWLDSGLRPGISGDDPGTYAINMFTEMQVLYAFQRAAANNAAFNGEPNPPAPITVRDVLEFATIRGAEGCALDHKVGTLTPGKEADIVIINADDIGIYPVHNAICTVVEGATPGNVDTVIIGGKIKKWGGKLVGFNLDEIKQISDDSRDFLFAETGWPSGVIDLSD